MIRHLTQLLAAIFVAVIPQLVFAEGGEAEVTERQYTYAWPYAVSGSMRPRGGTTKGTAVELATEPDSRWLALQAPGLSKIERDRRAILAMAGAYRASFDFLETAGFTLPYEAKRPYQSWGTEYVYVLADEPKFISLQHILVMQMQMPDGSVSEPIVVKHWRQDWAYQDRDLHIYRGHQTWEAKTLSRKETKHSWSQTVYQVDDSPRYESIGHWQHLPNYSSWVSGNTWRPLPRREFSVRDDYDVLIGTNRHTITPLGWIHEEENLKAVVDQAGEVQSIIAREAGFNRYERIIGFDFSAGDRYWQRTRPFWQDVASAWKEIYKDNKQFTINKEVEGTSLISAMFGYADKVAQTYDQEAAQAFISATLNQFLEEQ